jgi:transposase
MIALPPGVRIYLACGITDMRKGMVGLAMLVQHGLSDNPFSQQFMPSVGAALG